MRRLPIGRPRIDPPRSNHPVPTTMVAMLFLASLAPLACERDEPGPEPSVPASTTETALELRRGYEIPIPQLEYWDPEERTVLKYSYEMRFDPPGPGEKGPRLHRNGWAKAYYGSGGIEREGAYRFDRARNQSERVGTWTYYDAEGNPVRTEERGGEVIWTGPDQHIAPPGTEPAPSPSGAAP